MEKGSEASLRNLFKDAANAREYPAGTTIFEHGEPGDVMYIVLDGEVSIRVGEKTLASAGPGELIGEMALVDSRPRSASAVAATDCRLATVDEKRFLFLVQQTPFFALSVMRVMVERLRRTDELV